LRILITGAAGKCGSCLWDLNYDLTLLDKKVPVSGSIKLSFEQNHWVQGNINDYSLMNDLLEKTDIIIHLASANGKMHEDEARKNGLSWSEILDCNIDSLKMLLDISQKHKVEKFIFASSNHIFGNVELKNRPELYFKSKTQISDSDSYAPDSLYGVSKVFGELIGQYYAEKTGTKFYSLRIGSLMCEKYDSPHGYAKEGVDNNNWTKNSNQYLEILARTKCCWISRRDFRQIIQRLIIFEGKSFDTFFGFSNNKNCWFDLNKTKSLLGYIPMDSADS